MILKHKNGLKFFIFSKLTAFPEIRHGIFTRTRDDGRKSRNRLNVGLNVGDDEERVKQNRAIIAIQQEDCQAIPMYDPPKKVVANVHAGWRGNIKNIIGRCVESMQVSFGCNPQDMVAAISPSLGPCCSEFKNYQTEIPEKYWQYKDNYDHFNLWMMSFDQLLSAGLQRKNIELSNICTKCNDHLFFSYRKTNQTGRFVSVIGLK